MIHLRSSTAALAVLAAAGLAGACSRPPSGSGASAPPSAESHRAAVDQWRAKHDVDYRRDYVSIAGLYALKPGANTAGSAAGVDIALPPPTPPHIGRFVLEERAVRFEPTPGADVRLGGQPLQSGVALKDDGGPAPDELTIGDVRLVVHVSGDARMIRVRDPNGPLARGFLGFTWFPIDLSHRVVGRFIPDAKPRTLKVANTIGDIDEFATEGVVEFAWQGQTVRLRPFTTRPKRLYFVFRDASSGHETYEAARFLYADLAEDGSVVLDFNMAYNPPCSFNPYTTCPIPLAENRLPVKILAGEKAYPEHVPLTAASR